MKINYILNDVVEPGVSEFRMVGSCRLFLLLDELQIIAVIIMFDNNFQIMDLRHLQQVSLSEKSFFLHYNYLIS